MNQAPEMYYCIEEGCEEPLKVIFSVEDHVKRHNGHKCKAMSELRKELSNDSHSLKIVKSKGDTEIKLTYIDDQTKKISEQFQLGLKNLNQRLKQHVNENLISQSSEQLLQAILDNDQKQITLLQNSLSFLNKGQVFFESMDDYSVQVQQNLEAIFKNVADKGESINKLKLDNYCSFKWSETNRNPKIIQEQKRVSHNEYGWSAILLEPMLTFNSSQKIQLRIIKLSQTQEIFLQVCDLKIVKIRSPGFTGIYEQDHGAYSHYSNGQIYSTDAPAKGGAFSFLQGDIVELCWNGPERKFILNKVGTNETYEFNVKFKDDAEIYFAVSLYQNGSLEIV